MTVNKENLKSFSATERQERCNQPLEITETLGKYDIMTNARGGGVTGQAQAVRLGIARALIELNPEFRPVH